MSSWINWGIVFLAVFVVLLGVLFAAAPGFVRKNKGSSSESVSVWLCVSWSMLFTVIVISIVMLSMYFTGNKTLGFGCGCNGVKWGISTGVPTGLDGWSDVGY